MIPTAVSEVIEALGKLGAGLLCARYLKIRGYEENVIAAGAVFGVTVGALLSFIWLSLCGDKKGGEKKPPQMGRREIAKKLISLSVPITAGAAVMSLANVIDSAMCLNLLQRSGVAEYRSKWLFGAYTYATCILGFTCFLKYCSSLCIISVKLIYVFTYIDAQGSIINQLLSLMHS